MRALLRCRTSKFEHGSPFLAGFRTIVTTCRAVVLPHFGGPEVLQLRPDVEVPSLKPDEVLVRARAVSINPLDTRVRFLCLASYCLPVLELAVLKAVRLSVCF